MIWEYLLGILKFVDTFWGIDDILNIVLGCTVTWLFFYAERGWDEHRCWGPADVADKIHSSTLDPTTRG